MPTYRLIGHIIERGTARGVPSLRIEAWDSEALSTDIVAVARTDATGAFTIPLDDDYLDGVFPGRRPTISLRVFQGSNLLVTRTFFWKVLSESTSVRLEVDLSAPSGRDAPSPSIVRGVVRSTTGAPISGALVRAYDQNLTGADLLGFDTTDSAGRYQIAYASLTRPSKVRPDLVVRAVTEGGTPLGESGRICHAPATATVDLTIGGAYKGPSELEILEATIAQAIADFDLSTATNDQIEHIACSSGVDPALIAALVAALLLAAITGVDYQVLYGLIREGLSTDRRSLLRNPQAALRRALLAALDKNRIPAGYNDTIEAVMTQLRQAAVAIAFDTPPATATGNLGDLLATVLSTLSVQEELLDAYLANTGTIEDFWATLVTSPSFSDGSTVADLQFALQVGAITRYHFPLLKELQARRTAATITSVSDLARYSEADWASILDLVVGGHPIGFPADIPGANATEQKANYARVLKRTMETAYPTLSIAAEIAALPGGGGGLDIFFGNNPSFEFGKHRVGDYLANTPGALTGLSGAAAADATANLKHIERLFKLTPRYSEMKVLLDDDLHSARAIRRLGKTAFLGKYSSALGADSASMIFDNAYHMATYATALHTKFGPALNPPSAYVLPDLSSPGPAAPPAVADWKSLFGSLDACDCDHCNSVYGPAAYLVDLLQLLGRYDSDVVKSGSEKWSARDLLIGSDSPPYAGRRPDIASIELSCDNAEIPLPHVDLVNEILEHSVASKVLNAALDYPDHIKTTGTADELAAAPAPLPGHSPATDPRATAYLALANNIYPWAVPWSLWAEEARVYLDHLGVPRHALMWTLRTLDGSAPSAADIASERLGLSERERQIIIGGAISPAPGGLYAYWGLANAGALSTLTSVPVFLARSGLTYDDLLELLDTRFLERFGDLSLTASPGTDACNPDNLIISGITAGEESNAWTAIHRFLRLQRRIGYSIRELDQACIAFGAPAIDDAFLETLGAVERFRAAWQLPVTVVASWFGDLDTQPRDAGKTPSFYEQLFQNKAVTNPVDPKLAVDLVTDPGTTELLLDHADAIAGALRIGAQDLAILTDSAVSNAEIGEDSEIPDHDGSGPLPARLTLANLSKLHRIVTFSRALGLSIKDWLVIKKLSTIADPFTRADAPRFADIVDRVKAAGIAPMDLLYLFRDIRSQATAIAPTDVTIDTTLDALFAGLSKIKAKKATITDPTGEKLQGIVASFNELDTDHQEKTLAIIAGTWDPDDGAPETFFDDFMTGYFWDAPAAKAKLVTPDPGDPPLTTADRTSFAFAEMSTKGEAGRLIQQTLAAATQVGAPVAGLLLSSLSTDGSSTKLITAFLAPFLGADPTDLTTGARTAQRSAYRHLDKVASIVKSLSLSPAEIMRYTAILDLDALPRSPSDSPGTLFDDWQTLLGLKALRQKLPDGSAALLSIFSAAHADAVATLGQATGWTTAEITAIRDAIGSSFGVSTISDRATAATLIRLADAFTALKRLGVAASKALGWIAPLTSPPSAAMSSTTAAESRSAEIVQAAKARHTEDEWLAVARPLRDVLRGKQRDALVAVLLDLEGLTEPDDLFASLLVDVQIAPCQLTSRIKQAIGSVQTFVQRALLNLEDHVKLPAEAAEEWAWMKSYRVWEANRKVFLYPENWIEPELRDDKSPFFEALERELRQQDITDEVAEAAYAHYLEQLDEVARLDVAAMFHQIEDGDADHPPIDILHVIGRTRLTPHAYFYRTRVDASAWTPWQKIDLDIPGDQLLLFVDERRLHLFWPVFSEKPDDNQPIGAPDQAGVPAKKHLEILLAWSEYQSGKWTAPRTSTGGPITVSPALPTEWISLVAEETSAPSPSAPARYQITCVTNGDQWDAIYGSTLFRIGSFLLGGCGATITAVDNRRVFSFSSIGGAPLSTTFTLGGQFYKRNMLDTSVGTIRLTRVEAATAVYQEDQETAQHQSSGGGLALRVVLDDTPQFMDVLATTPYGRFRVLSPHMLSPDQHDFELEHSLLFFKDDVGTYFVEQEMDTAVTWHLGERAQPGFVWQIAAGSSLATSGSVSSTLNQWANLSPAAEYFPHVDVSKGYRFSTFYHPHVCAFRQALNRDGVRGLLGASSFGSVQFLKNDLFGTRYHPHTDAVKKPYPVEDVDFSFRGAYSLYNWELFFHAPFLIATRLMQNQRFEEAQRWFHFIFDPTSGGTGKAPQRFWKVRPFYENTDLATIEQELVDLALTPDDQSPATQALRGLLQLEGDNADKADLHAQITAWQKDPFNPHLIARMRPIAYQKAVVMRYIENLITWGDQLFRRDTIESINEATQLYILAQNLLGPRPRRIAPRNAPAPMTYRELAELDLDAFSDPLVEVESVTPAPLVKKVAVDGQAGPPDLHTLYFCVPGDDALLVLWDTVADRLFKLRHCMNIDGVTQSLPLFEPPIDPALLVQAAAAGVDLTSALSDVNAAIPLYRFSVMHAKATELAAGVSALGASFLSALEKKDAEGLAQLRAGQEIDLLTAVRETKAQQLAEANQNLAALNKSLEAAQVRRDYYANRPFMNVTEGMAMATSTAAMVLGAVSAGIAGGASVAHALPTINIGVSGAMASPVATVALGGPQLGPAVDAASQWIGMAAGLTRDSASIMSTLAGYERRKEEWNLQADLAQKDIEQIGKQIAAAQIRVALAQKELDNHDLQIDQARTTLVFMRDKFTSEDLYDWMSAELSTVFFQAYQLAYDVAKQAERAFRFERGIETSSYIIFGYWDSLKRGLLSGERLQQDLRRLEIAYLEQNARELEITKHVSLAMLDPEALMTLRETGTCTFFLDEATLDLDYPGHFMRRIKSVSLTLPAVTGPYTSVNCTLRLKRSWFRKVASGVGTYTNLNKSSPDDNVFQLGAGALTEVATSGAQNDAGLFEVNFRDERYLPFEGAGAISEWELILPRRTNGFDVAALEDVIVHIRYMARDGGDAFRDKVNQEVVAKTPRAGKQIFSARAQFPDQWAQFMSPPAGQDHQDLVLPFTPEMFPFLVGAGAPTITQATIHARWNKISAVPPAPEIHIDVTQPSASVIHATILKTSEFGTTGTLLTSTTAAVGTWTMTVASDDIKSAGLPAGLYTQEGAGAPYRLNDTLEDVWLVFEYTQPVPSVGAWA